MTTLYIVPIYYVFDVSVVLTDVNYGMAGLRRCVQTIRVYVETSEGCGKRGPEAKLFFTTDIQWSVPVLFNGNQTGSTRCAVRVAQVNMHVHDAHQSKSFAGFEYL